MSLNRQNNVVCLSNLVVFEKQCFFYQNAFYMETGSSLFENIKLPLEVMQNKNNLLFFISFALADQKKYITYPIFFGQVITFNNQNDLRTAIFKDLGNATPSFVIQGKEKTANNNFPITHLELALVNVSSANDKNTNYVVDEQKLTALVRAACKDFSFSINQLLFLEYQDNDFKITLHIKVKQIKYLQDQSEQSINPENHFYFQCIHELTNTSEIHFTTHCKQLELIGYTSSGLPKNFSLNFDNIGGLQKEIHAVIRSFFVPRFLGHLGELYGDILDKGVVFYGLPGTGKTTIAREIAKAFPKKLVVLINGSELRKKYVGESGKELRKLFKPPRENPDKFYVIILEELDGLCPSRNDESSGSASVTNDLTTQLLTLLDGVVAVKNILVIGTTNRIDLIDPALLRPGRLGIHIEIKLPDEKQRLEILNIKTNNLQKNLLIENDVNLEHWAKLAVNFSGAELTQLVQEATHIAQMRNLDTDLKLKAEIINPSQLSKVKNDDFKQAFEVLKNNKTKKTFKFRTDNFITDFYIKAIENFQTQVHILKKQIKVGQLPQLNYLITGKNGSGKTSLAKFLAQFAGLTYIKWVKPTEIQEGKLNQIINEAQQTENYVLILDDVEYILGADTEFKKYNNNIRIKLLELLNPENAEKPCVIIATTSNINFLERMGLLPYFNDQYTIPSIILSNKKEQEKILLQLLAICSPQTRIKIIGAEKHHDQKITLPPFRELLGKLRKCIKNDTLDVGELLLEISPTLPKTNLAAMNLSQYFLPAKPVANNAEILVSKKLNK